jgi:hypothetical protein
VRVALDRHAERAAEAEVCYLQDVARLVHQQVLRLQVSGRHAHVCASAFLALYVAAARAHAPVHDAMAVQVRNANAQLIHEVLRVRVHSVSGARNGRAAAQDKP